MTRTSTTERNGQSRAKQEPGSPGNGGHANAATAELAVDQWARSSQIALIGLFAIALLWCAYVARHVIIPLLLAWVIATIVLPIVRWLQDHRIPRVAAVLLVTTGLVMFVFSLLVALAAPASTWLGRAAELTAVIKEKLQTVGQPLALLEEARKALGSIATSGTAPALKVEQEPATVTAILSVLAPAVSQFLLFVGALLFYLVYQERLRTTIVLLFTDRDTRLTTLHILSAVDENMTRYFGAFTLVNVCLGAIVIVLTWVLGLPNPLLWGVLAALLNYIPYVGPGIVILTLGVVSLLTYPTLSEALVPPLIYLGIVTVEGQFLTPAFMGQRLELNPFAVFLAIAFCAWLFGPVGAFLAVPLLMVLTITVGQLLAEEKPDLPE
jgi:predicted PurR-regulated permease PerM